LPTPDRPDFDDDLNLEDLDDFDEDDLDEDEGDLDDLPAFGRGAAAPGPGDEDDEPAEGYERLPEPRALSAAERSHPLAESGWLAVAHTTMDGAVDSLLIEKGGRHRLIELYDDYRWCSDKRCLEWPDFVRIETEDGDRRGWTEAIADKLAVYGHAVSEPRVWVARNDDFGADWMLGLEF